MFRMLKVRPPHGWGAVAWELGIVVLGVLIALGAQQLVESWQWDAEVKAERASLLEEASDGLAVIANRNAQVPCVDSGSPKSEPFSSGTAGASRWG